MQKAKILLLKLYRKLPLSAQLRQHLRGYIFNKFPFVIRYIYPVNEPVKNLESAFLDVAESLAFPVTKDPLVSVIIPAYNNIQYTYSCIQSIFQALPQCSFEIIIVDDYSADNTVEVLSKIPGISVLTNPNNLGFIRTCNMGAKMARGKYLFFLNNDTKVLPGWLDELVATFSLFPEAGMVGSKLIYPNGQLQEAGGIVWKDGSAWNFGRGEDPNKPEYNYLREVDYCSGAAIMVPRVLFEQVEGFDPYYLPAYYEDTDLAFTLRTKGYKIFYQPLSQIIHFEGISLGTDVTQGVKAYQVTNGIKFYEKWQAMLLTHRNNAENPYLEKERKVQKRVLFIDACTPTPDEDAGSVIAFFYIKIFLELGFKVTFIPLDNFAYFGAYTQDLQRIGVECLYAPYVMNLHSYLQPYGHYFDLAVLNRVNYAALCIDEVRLYCPKAKIVFNTADLHYLREERQAKIENSEDKARLAEKTKKIELEVMRKSDCTILVSEFEKQLIQRENKGLNLSLIPLIMEIPGKKKFYADRRDILYLGGFRHTPNIDAVLYFVREIWPRVKQQLPELKFYILGSNVPDAITVLAKEDIVVVGYVKDLSQYFDFCRLSVAPLRFGAGIKGKIGVSLSYGMPCVATSIAAEGMKLTHGENIIVADGEINFANHLVNLYNNEVLWNKISDQGLDFTKRHYSFAVGKQHIANLLEKIGMGV